jgi:hypothetical protein
MFPPERIRCGMVAGISSSSSSTYIYACIVWATVSGAAPCTR